MLVGGENGSNPQVSIAVLNRLWAAMDTWGDKPVSSPTRITRASDHRDIYEKESRDKYSKKSKPSHRDPGTHRTCILRAAGDGCHYVWPMARE